MKAAMADFQKLFKNNPVISVFLSAVFLVMGLVLFYMVTYVWDYTYPSAPIAGSLPLPVFIENRVIKVALDVNRSRDCLASSTILLSRNHEYQAPYDDREDMVTLSLLNTSLTTKGEHRIMLWFPIPSFIPPDNDWAVEFHTQDDCGGPMSGSSRPSRPVLIRHLQITKDDIP